MSYDVCQIELRHDGLKKYRIIRGDRYIVEQKVAALKASWEEMWEKKIAREAALKEKKDNKQLALERTQEAESKIDEVKNILQHTIDINDAINWDSLLDKSEYPKSSPERPKPLLVPIMQLNKEDKRFVSPYTVIDSIDNVTNIAAMDWQDFENLIRELFEKEFAPQGGEVKITRVSRDEGVDAVIFDPDPY